MKQKIAIYSFIGFVALSLLSPVWVFKDLLFPFITSKAFLFRIFIELAFPFYLYLLAVNKSFRPSWKNPLLWALGLFVVFSFISAKAGVNETRSMWGNFERMGGVYYIAHLTLLAFYIAALGQMGGRYLKFILYWALGVAMFITFNGISGWLGGPTVVVDPTLPTRVSSTLGNPIFLGSFLILPMFLSLFFALETESKPKKIMFWIFAFLQFMGIFLSVTRGALVGMIAGLILAGAVYVFLTPIKKIRLFGIPTVIIGSALVVLLFVFHSSLPQNRITRIFNLYDSNTQARFVQWKVALTGFKDRPILGVGSENYYYIANKYYNPELIKYDPSWFDKPHNYILEVLVTGGILSFIPYAAIMVLVLWALYRGYKSEFLSLGQMCLLGAGFIAYLVQNLTVFDTIPASLMFFVFTGFASFLWLAGQNEPGKNKFQAADFFEHPATAATLALVGAVAALYAVFLTNIEPLKAAKNVNYGYAYISVDQKKSYDYFQEAVNNDSNFDQQDTAVRFSELANNLIQTTQLSPADVKKMVDTITANQKLQAERIGNDPVSWQRLANDYYLQAVMNKGELGPYAEYAVKKAIEMAPNRFEPALFLAQIYLAENRPDKALEQLSQMDQSIPLTGYSATSRWLQAYVYHSMGKDEEGIKIAQKLLDLKFNPNNYRDLLWVINYYVGKNDLNRALELSQLANQLFPSDADAYFNTAQILAKLGQTALAKEMSHKLIDNNAPNKAAVEIFLKTLQ